jgi:hypothetical protein
VGSTPTQSIFIILVNYGIKLRLFFNNRRTEPDSNCDPSACFDFSIRSASTLVKEVAIGIVRSTEISTWDKSIKK